MSMADADPVEPDGTRAPEDDGSIRASVTRLLASGKELAEAELAWARAKGAVVAAGLSMSLIWAVLALILAVMGIGLLVVAAIVALMPLVGLLAASLIVAGLAILGALLCGLAARRTLANLFAEDA